MARQRHGSERLASAVVDAKDAQRAAGPIVIDPVRRNRLPPDRPRSRADDQLGSIEVSPRERVEATLQCVDESRSGFGTKSLERVIDEAGEIGLSQLG